MKPEEVTDYYYELSKIIADIKKEFPDFDQVKYGRLIEKLITKAVRETSQIFVDSNNKFNN